MMFIRGLLAGTVSVGVSCFAFYYALLERRAPHIEYEESTTRKTGVSKILRFGIPQRSPEVILYKGHALCYDQQRRIPVWVAEHLTASQLTGDAKRKYAKFKPDPSVVEMFSAKNDDYLGSGWSRGHMAAAGNYKHDQEAMDATFFLSNIVPQDKRNNAEYWNHLEIFCRNLATKYDHVHVISGPLFLPTNRTVDGLSKKFVTYEVIGANDVAVPSHLFKIIVAENEGESKPLIATFVLPNKPIDLNVMLTSFQVPLEFVELRSGVLMLPSLDRRAARNLCAVEACDFRTVKEFELRAYKKQA